MKTYVAGPFFSEGQLKKMERVEAVLAEFSSLELFKPRNAKAAAKKLNKSIGAGKDPSADTRTAVFRDNVVNIDDAELMVAVTDDRDIGTTWEMGYAYAKGIPTITFTDEGWGQNLMVAESILAHTKGLDQLRRAVAMFIAQVNDGGVDTVSFDEHFKRANLLETKQADRDNSLYRKGE